jgi:two-component system response regulator HydG
LCAQPVALEVAREAVANGAYDVIALDSDDAAARAIDRVCELDTVAAGPPLAPGIVAQSAAGRAMLAQLAHAARTSMPVLITGETGTGKEEAAALIHAWSARHAAPYVPVNCAAIPDELMESELFGHARGAFSGAVASVDGRLIAADRGTVFLDEIDDTPLSTQVKLLRVLEDGEVTRLGETRGRKVDFRIVAATNRDLGNLIAAGSFGLDFYERLAIVRIALPPLRARQEDIAPLTEHFIATYFERERLPRSVHLLSPLALSALEAHAWPGNVRELRNVVFSALVNKRAGDTLLLSDLPRLESLAHGQNAERGTLIDATAIRTRIRERRFNLRSEIAAFERAALEVALQEAQHSPTEAARLLGEVGRGKSRDPGGTVRAMMRRHTLE